MSEETENNGITFDNLRVENKEVHGNIYTREFMGGYTVLGSVTSYQYEKNGEMKHNHVPNVVIQKAGGGIAYEMEPSDSHSPEQAIENARNAVKYAYNHADKFVSSE